MNIIDKWKKQEQALLGRLDQIGKDIIELGEQRPHDSPISEDLYAAMVVLGIYFGLCPDEHELLEPDGRHSRHLRLDPLAEKEDRWVPETPGGPSS